MSERTTVWGPVASVLFTFVVITASFMSQTIGVVLSAVDEDSDLDFENPESAALALNDGAITTTSLALSAVVCVILTVLIIKLKSGSRLKDYLALHSVPLSTLLKWIGIGVAVLVAVQVIFSIIPQLLEIPVDVGDVATEFETADIPLLYVLTIAVLVPVFEEVLFRGFLFKGLEATRLGPVGAIVAVALLFAVIHVQYSLIVLVNVFCIGILFGFARYKTNSLLTPIVLHILLNSVSLLPAFL